MSKGVRRQAIANLSKEAARQAQNGELDPKKGVANYFKQIEESAMDSKIRANYGHRTKQLMQQAADDNKRARKNAK